MSISFFFEDTPSVAFSRREIKSWIIASITFENKKVGNINFIFCSDRYLLKINQQYLKHDYFTDIVTFDYVEGDIISGDVFISIDRVKENSGIYNVSFETELHRIIIHGVLHLLGYHDKDPEDKTLMTRKEDYYLSRF